MCRALYAPMHLLCLTDQNTLPMYKLYYSVLQTDHMLPIRIEDTEDQSKQLTTNDLNLFWQILKMQ